MTICEKNDYLIYIILWYSQKNKSSIYNGVYICSKITT